MLTATFSDGHFVALRDTTAKMNLTLEGEIVHHTPEKRLYTHSYSALPGEDSINVGENEQYTQSETRHDMDGNTYQFYKAWSKSLSFSHSSRRTSEQSLPGSLGTLA